MKKLQMPVWKKGKVRAKGSRKWTMGSLRTQLIAVFAIVLLIPALLVGIISYRSADSNLHADVEATVDENVMVLNSILNDTIKQKFDQTSTMASVFHKTDDPKTITASLQTFASLHPEITSIYVGTDQGQMMLAPSVSLPDDFDPRKRPWYEDAVQANGKVVMTDPYQSADSGGAMVVTIARTLSDGSGVLGMDLSLDRITTLARSISFGKKGYAFILDKDQRVIHHPDLENGSEAPASMFDSLYTNDSGDLTMGEGGEEHIVSYLTNELTGWKVAGAYPHKEIDEAVAPILRTTGIVVVAAIVIGGLLITAFLFSILRPLRQIHQAVDRISKGDLTHQIEVSASHELGDLAQGFNVMSSHLRQLIQEVGIHAGHVASSAEELTAGAEQTEKATEQISNVIQGVAAGTDRQLKHVEDNSASVGSMSRQARDASDQMLDISDRMASAAGLSLEGKEAMEAAVDQMAAVDASVQELAGALDRQGERSEEIGRIVEIMAELSAQTNLLSLNAAIEAARAGEHGRGFAVVAEEVRKLADQSAASGKRIATLVTAIQSDTRQVSVSMGDAQAKLAEGVRSVEAAGTRFHGIYSSVQGVTGDVGDMAGLITRFAEQMTELSTAMAEVQQLAIETVDGTQTVSASTEEQLASMEEIASSAASLGKMAEELQAMTERFRV
ncbi:methyl-accepting chemotaxis protein [Gorillibacterium sp. CAU 1737]|uniref:methyl-accepting chemotaxis protein n=1 Tax=Gorillibacterium sp. CAU 1737 TaxID=3140362 RepID=UPI003260AD5E